MTPVKVDEFWTIDDGAPLDPDVYGSGLLSDTIDAYRDRVAELEAQLKEANVLLKYMASYPCDFCAGFTTNHEIDCEYAAYLTKWSVREEP